MDFDLFMERYGYKVLLAVFVGVALIVVGIPIVGFILSVRTMGYVGGAMLIAVLVYALVVNRRVMDSYAEAQGKYFYDPKYGKKR